MKLKNVALLSLSGMLLSSASVYALAPSQGQAVAEQGSQISLTSSTSPGALTSSFEAGATLRVDGRIGHPRLLQGASGETFILLEVGSGEGPKAPRAAPSHLALVIDRSGSMRGERLKSAISGAMAAVDQLGDGDAVSVVAFDARPSLVVPSTVIGPESRERVKATIRTITVGGETCISCGIEEAVGQLAQSNGKVDRMIVLSDGDATAGVRDPVGFRGLARRARERGIGVTTIGVGVTYNQRILGIIAQESGGGHHFIENASSLDRVFLAEAEKLRSTVAIDVEATLELAEGVELDQVFDRTFQRRGQKIVIPLDAFARGDTQTVLLKVRVPSHLPGAEPVADVHLAYRDLVKGEDGRCDGKLGVVIRTDPSGASPLDGVVAGRLQRSATAAALLEANVLFEQGKIEEAQRKLALQQQALNEAGERARRAAPKNRGADVDKDFRGQASSLDSATWGLNKTSPRPAAAVRRNQEMANPFMK